MKERENLMEQKVTHKQWLIVSWASWVTPVPRYYLRLTMDCRGNLYFRWRHWRKQEKQMARNWMRLWMTSWKRWVRGPSVFTCPTDHSSSFPLHARLRYFSDFYFRPKWQSSWLLKKNSCINKFIITRSDLKISMILCQSQMKPFPVSG